jgi:hypothetical protein
MIGVASSPEDAATIKVMKIINLDFSEIELRVAALTTQEYPVFTQQHYRAIAEVIHQRRLAIKAEDALPEKYQSNIHPLDVIADLQKDLIDLFKKDNAKFNPLLFIAASSKDLA